MRDLKSLPIGLFDSGMGGLTVFKAIAGMLPSEDLIYLGDTARLPYGTKGRETIIRYTLLAARHLVGKGVKMLVVACNTATANALPALQAELAPLPIVGVVEPGAEAAVSATRNGQILVIATEATISSGVYARAIKAIDPKAVTRSLACTLFVPLAEEGLISGPIVEGVAHHYLDGQFGPNLAHPDTLLLGCTHFPMLKYALERVVGREVAVVDPAQTVATKVKNLLRDTGLLCEQKEPGQHYFLTTDNQQRFAKTGSLFLGEPLSIEKIELIDL